MSKVVDAPADENIVEGESNGDERETSTRPFLKRPVVKLVVAIVLGLVLIFGIRYYLHSRAYQSTDDAFIDGQIIPISPRVAGHVLKVYVVDNQQVKKGDLLVELDPRDLQARLDQARGAFREAESRESGARSTLSFTQVSTRATIEQASSGVSAAKSTVGAAQAQVAAARGKLQETRAATATTQANVTHSQAEFAAAQAEALRATSDEKRYEQLFKLDEVSRQQLDQAIATAQTADANLEAARSRVAAMEAQVAQARAAEESAAGNLQQMHAQVGSTQAQVRQAVGQLSAANTAPEQVAVSESQVQTAGATIEQARAAVEQAELELSYCRIVAPEDGRVTLKAVEQGQYLQVGQTLMSLVSGQCWVTANFKETQLDQMRPGQQVEVLIDAYAGKVFKAHIDSIQSGSGSRFSLLPPENATGNYVKVVQRVPVKIVFDEPPDPNYAFRPGMSAEPEVRVR